jgi:acyl-CoA thioester hydrolase
VTEAPEDLVFEFDLVVADADIDMLGHASNIAFVRWIQDVAMAHSAAVGLGFEVYQRIGAVFVVVRQQIDYLRPALRGDVVQARTWLSNVGAAKCERSSHLLRKSDGQMLAKALTTWGFIDMASGRPTRIPQDVRVAFKGYIH